MWTESLGRKGWFGGEVEGQWVFDGGDAGVAADGAVGRGNGGHGGLLFVTRMCGLMLRGRCSGFSSGW